MAGDNNTLYEQVLGAEQSVIGSMLIDPKTVGLVVAELSEEDFSLEATRNLFRAFRKLYLENRIMDPVTVLAAIGPQDASMRSYVMELMDRTLTPANIAEYIEQVKRESLRLRLQNIGRELLERLSNPEDAMPLLMRGMELLSGQSTNRNTSPGASRSWTRDCTLSAGTLSCSPAAPPTARPPWPCIWPMRRPKRSTWDSFPWRRAGKNCFRA